MAWRPRRRLSRQKSGEIANTRASSAACAADEPGIGSAGAVWADVQGAPSPRSPHEHVFVFEPLEPRLLLSADLSPLAGTIIVTGLSHLDQVFNQLSVTPEGAAT